MNTQGKPTQSVVETLLVCRQYCGLRIKVQVFPKELEFLRHIISSEGVKPNEECIKSIQEAPRPVKAGVTVIFGVNNIQCKVCTFLVPAT